MAYTNSLLKAMLVAEDVTLVRESVTKDKCYVVQHFSYGSQRNRLASQMVNRMEDSSYIDFVVRIADTYSGKQFYQQMKDSEPYTYSFIFNAVYNGSGRLLDYEDVMMVKGYIIDIEEDISASNQDEGRDTQVLMKVRLLLCSITYLGNESNLVLNIK